MPPITGLVNCAGIAQIPKSIEDYAVADWARERAGAMNWIQRGSGALLLGLGLHLALYRK